MDRTRSAACGVASCTSGDCGHAYSGRPRVEGIVKDTAHAPILVAARFLSTDTLGHVGHFFQNERAHSMTSVWWCQQDGAPEQFAYIAENKPDQLIVFVCHGTYLLAISHAA